MNSIFKIQKNGFLGTDDDFHLETSYKKSWAVIVPFGMEATVSYGQGTRRGPKAIIEASHQLNENDEQTLKPVYRCGIATLKETRIPKNPKLALNSLRDTVLQILADKKFPIVLGGEHSLTQGSLTAACFKYPDVSLLQFDAHADLREKYHGSVYSHASVMRQALKTTAVRHLTQIGIRSVSKFNDELPFLKRNRRRITTFWAWKKFSLPQILASIPTKNVYVTFDIDAFDPGIMPATGTPEPGGLAWWPTLKILKAVFNKKNVVSCDIVELAPIKGLRAPDFLAARLVYKLIGYKFNQVRT